MYVLSELLQGCSNAKILEVILENYDEKLTVDDISEMANVTKNQSLRYLRHLAKKGIVDWHETKDKGEFWTFNKDNPVSKAFMLLEHQIVSTGLEKAIKKATKNV